MVLDTSEETYEIGAVARLTGISPHVLRVWERRYTVVEPLRTDSKRRRYTKDDVDRLSLVKVLVDNGNAISTVANLDLEQLKSRVGETIGKEEGDRTSCRFITIGAQINPVAREAVAGNAGLILNGDFATAEQAFASVQKGAADLVVVERATVFKDTTAEISRIADEIGASRAIVVYQFADREALLELKKKSITALRAPVNAKQFQLAALEGIEVKSPESDKSADEETLSPFSEDGSEIAERIFSDEKLVKLTQISSVVKCECPQHLASLISSLAAFEEYSRECESRNAADEAIHSYLYRSTAKCRADMEAALTRVLEHEGIDDSTL